MAGNENSGGFQPNASQNNFGVSGIGGAGSADGVPNIDYTGFAYGQNGAINAQQSAAPMGPQTQAMPALPEITPITAPSTTLERPITYGMPFGDGAGSEILPLPAMVTRQSDPSRQVIRAMYQQNPRNEDLRAIVETMDFEDQQMVQ
jgi:hypothetical protein